MLDTVPNTLMLLAALAHSDDHQPGIAEDVKSLTLVLQFFLLVRSAILVMSTLNVHFIHGLEASWLGFKFVKPRLYLLGNPEFPRSVHRCSNSWILAAIFSGPSKSRRIKSSL